jgi:hypothetical protein
MVSDRAAKTQAGKGGFGTKETRARDCGTVLFRSVLEGSDARHNSGIQMIDDVDEIRAAEDLCGLLRMGISK